MKKKKHSRIWAVASIILLGIVAVGSIYSHFGGFGTGPCADETEFMQYADQVDNIKIPEKTKKVGASASPPAAGKEVNSVSRVPGGVVCFVARMPRAFAFLFWIGGASVLARYSIN